MDDEEVGVALFERGFGARTWALFLAALVVAVAQAALTRRPPPLVRFYWTYLRAGAVVAAVSVLSFKAGVADTVGVIAVALSLAALPPGALMLVVVALQRGFGTGIGGLAAAVAGLAAFATYVACLLEAMAARVRIPS